MRLVKMIAANPGVLRRNLMVGSLVLLLASCGGSDSDADTTEREEMMECSLLMTSDLEAQGIRVISGPTWDSRSPNSQCSFETEPWGGADALGAVIVTVYSPSAAGRFSPDSAADSESVGEIGVEAWLSENGRIAQATLADGGAIEIFLSEPPSTGARQVLVPLLAQAVERSGSGHGSANVEADDVEERQDP